jgi:hypothetical protein
MKSYMYICTQKALNGAEILGASINRDEMQERAMQRGAEQGSLCMLACICVWTCMYVVESHAVRRQTRYSVCARLGIHMGTCELAPCRKASNKGDKLFLDCVCMSCCVYVCVGCYDMRVGPNSSIFTHML